MSILPPKHSAVRVRLTQADRDVLEARARQSGVALSVVVRRAIRMYINSPSSAKHEEQSSLAEHKTKSAISLPPQKFLGSSDGRGGA